MRIRFIIIVASLALFTAPYSFSADKEGAELPQAGNYSATLKAAAKPELVVIEPVWDYLDKQSAASIRKAWDAALVLLAAETGAVRFRVVKSNSPPPPEGTALVRVTITGEPGSFNGIFQLAGVASAPNAMKYTSFTSVGETLYLEFARMLQSLSRYLETTAKATGPVLIDSFSPADLLGVDFQINRSVLYPYGLAAGENGALIVACGSLVLAMDRRWQVTGLPAKKLSDEGNFNFAHSVALTPAGTLYLRSADGSGLWAFPDGGEDYRKLRIDSQAGGGFGIMDDGSPFLVDAETVRIYRGRMPVRFKLPAGISAPAAASGPDDTIWVSDASRGALYVMATDGKVRNLVYPDLPLGTMVMKMRIFADGGFLAVTNSDIRRFDPSGRMIWNWDGKAEGLSILFSTFTDVAVQDDGIVYVNDFMGKRILRLAERPEEIPADLAAVAAAGKALRADANRAELTLALADAYDAMGASEAARTTLERYLEDRPADGKALDRKLRLETALLKTKAKAAEKDTLHLLDQLGTESAREAYGRAMRTYESILAMAGEDGEVREATATLRRVFQERERGTETALPSPVVVSTELAALFPALLQAYRTRAAGSVVLKNTLDAPIRNVRAGLFIRKYMDFPSTGKEIAVLEPGNEVRLDLPALLNQEVLEVQEDLPLQALVSVQFTDKHGERSIEFSRPVTLYRKTAITWEDTGKLAAFITPNEETVARMAFDFLSDTGNPSLVSRTFRRAMLICDALGSLPMTYVIDPQSPITEVLGKAGSVDTVRFPRTTLAYKGGDCDDSTAMLASLLEAAGIKTAILTSPGHVFLAFDTGEREDNGWLFAADGLKTIKHGGTLWIPLETTVLAEGFPNVWKRASALVDLWEGTADFEFLAVADLRTSYPSLPLPPSTIPVLGPDPSARAQLAAKSTRTVESEWYPQISGKLEKEIARLTGRDWSKASNRLAQLHTRYGRYDKALPLLADIIRRDPDWLAARLNLANMSLQAGKKDEALVHLRNAAQAFPGNATVADFSRKLGLALDGSSKPVELAGTQADFPVTRASAQEAPLWVDE